MRRRDFLRAAAALPLGTLGGCSRRGGAAMTRPLRRGVLSRIGLEAAAPVAPAAATPAALQATVAALRGDWL